MTVEEAIIGPVGALVLACAWIAYLKREAARERREKNAQIEDLKEQNAKLFRLLGKTAAPIRQVAKIAAMGLQGDLDATGEFETSSDD